MGEALGLPLQTNAWPLDFFLAPLAIKPLHVRSHGQLLLFSDPPPPFLPMIRT